MKVSTHISLSDFYKRVESKNFWIDMKSFRSFIQNCDKKGLITIRKEGAKPYIEERYVGFFLNLHSLSSVYLLLTIYNKC